MDDRNIMENILLTTKGACDPLMHGTLESSTANIHQAFSKALNEYEPELRAVLKQAGFLTRDDRVVERKKYGRAKARRSYQFSKR